MVKDDKMRRLLRVLFDYQQFADNERLAAVIGQVVSGYCVPLSDDELECINAAGEVPASGRPDTAMGDHSHG